MSVGFVAYHYPSTEAFDSFLARARRAATVMGSAPGCITTDCLLSIDGAAVVTVAVWANREAQRRSYASAEAAGVDFSFDDRELRPRTITSFGSEL